MSLVTDVATIATASPELLAPAGDWDCLRAAVANGANAVYFGLPTFNARYRATNFTLEELPTVMRFLHDHNVRGYVAFNTLIFSDELPDAIAAIQAAVAAGVDALIVQDLGLARLLHRAAPQLALHGSTQMTLTEPRGIEFVRRLGIERVILARELSLADIRRIRSQTQVPVEVFVHGALCVAYSGQCLTSEALGGRSANRGQCAQACRMPYELVVDGVKRDLGDRAYLLSPQDLAAHDLIAELVALGVCSLKIEGRLKTPQYVAMTTQTYRAAIEAAAAGEDFKLSEQGQLDLAQTFSRGFSTAFLGGLNHQTLVPAKFPKSRGVLVGTITGVSRRGLTVELDARHPGDVLKAGDGVCIDRGRPEEKEQGGRVFSVDPIPGDQNSSRLVLVSLAVESLRLEEIPLGARLWRTDDPALRKRLESTFARDLIVHRQPVHFRLRGNLSGPLTLAVETESRDPASESFTAIASWPGPLVAARSQPWSTETVMGQLSRLGDTPFGIGRTEIDVDPSAMLPKSVLNDLRRQVTQSLVEQRESRLATRSFDVAVLPSERSRIVARPRVPRPDAPRLYPLVRSMAQLEAVLAWQPPATLQRPGAVYCDFEDVRRYREAVAKAHDAGLRIGVATLRICKPGEEGLLAQTARCGADAVLVRNLAAIGYLQDYAPHAELIGDFSLNIANELTAELFREQGLARLVPSYDLSWEQLAAMISRSDAGLYEVVVHQHMPMFHMEHCVFAATLSSGKDWRDCGRPCDRHQVVLRDHVGSAFPLLADTGCRNTVFNSVAQSAAEYVPRMLAAGLCHFRVELLRESAGEIAVLLERYARVLAGLDAGRTTWRSLQVLNQLGVTRGTLQVT